MKTMKFSGLKYFSTLIVFTLALLSAWWAWNYYMQSPWTRDGKVRAELVDITPQISGRIVALKVTDNQFVHKGETLLTLDPVPWQIDLNKADAQLSQAKADLAKAQNEFSRRSRLPRNTISGEDLDVARLNADAALASVKAAQAQRDQAQWNLQQTTLTAPTDGWVSNLTLRPATTPAPVRRFLPWSTATLTTSSATLKKPSCATFILAPLPTWCFTAAARS